MKTKGTCLTLKSRLIILFSQSLFGKRNNFMLLLFLLAFSSNIGQTQINFGQTSTISLGTIGGDTFGNTIATGDIDNDNFSELIVSDPYNGTISVFLGGENGIANTSLITLNVIPQPNPAAIPQPVIVADVNDDGFADILVGQPQAGLGLATNAGQVRIFINTGIAPFFQQALTTVLLPNQSLQGGRFGWSIDVGDFNGDDILDVIVGEPRVNLSFFGSGAAVIFNGPLTGGFPIPNQTLFGNQGDDWFGYVVKSAQVLGDFRDEAIIGSPGFDINGNPNITGRIQVFAGTPGGLNVVPAVTFTDPCPAGLEFARFFDVGDVDGNGFADLVVGSRFMGINCAISFPGSIENLIYVFLSNGATVNTIPASTLTVPSLSGNAAAFERQIILADVNSDSFEDVMVGAPLAYVNGQGSAGTVHLFTGNDTPPGVDTPAAQVLEGSGASAFFGTSAAVANIQGSDDVEILIGAPQNAFGAGEVILFGITDCQGVPGGSALPGSACNDGDPDTINDEYDNNCNCVGVPAVCNNCPDALICDNFETYIDDEISPQSDHWTLWNTNSLDGIINSDMASEGSQSMEIAQQSSFSQQDVLLLLGDKTQGKYRLSFNMYIPDNRQGYFNLQKFQNIPGAEWGFEIYFYHNTLARIRAGGGNGWFLYPQDDWIQIELYFDIDNNIVRFYLNGIWLFYWNLSYQATNPFGTLQVGAIDFYGGDIDFNSNTAVEYYIDEICYQQVNALPFNGDSLDDREVTAQSITPNPEEMGNVVYKDGRVSINEFQPDLMVWPNPSSGKFTLNMNLANSESVILEVVNSSGQQVKKFDLGRINNIEKEVDLTGMPPGLYFVKVHTSNAVYHKKLILIR